MRNALIESNRPVCPKCREDHFDKLKVVDVNVASINNKRHFEIAMKCRSCSEVSYYFLDLEMMNRVSINRETDETYEKIRPEE